MIFRMSKQQLNTSNKHYVTNGNLVDNPVFTNEEFHAKQICVLSSSMQLGPGVSKTTERKPSMLKSTSGYWSQRTEQMFYRWMYPPISYSTVWDTETGAQWGSGGFGDADKYLAQFFTLESSVKKGEGAHKTLAPLALVKINSFWSLVKHF